MHRTIRVPERKKMTIGIAVLCDTDANGIAKIVCCTDALVSGSLGKQETLLKNRPMALGWGILTAGDDYEMGAVTEIVRRKLRTARAEKHFIDDTYMLALLRSALAERKHEKADEIIQGQYGISYDELRRVGLAQFPPDVYRDAMWTVRDSRIRAEFIVYGFTSLGLPLVLKTTQEGVVKIIEDWGVIGEGGYLAQTVLMHRGTYEMMPLANATYIVYEAKKYAENAPSVGTNVTTLVVAHPDGRRQIFSPEGKKWADIHYSEFGPKPLPKETMTLPSDAWFDLRRSD